MANSSWGYATESKDATLEDDESPWEANFSENKFTIGFDLIGPFDSIQFYNSGSRNLLKISSDFDQTSVYLVNSDFIIYSINILISIIRYVHFFLKLGHVAVPFLQNSLTY